MDWVAYARAYQQNVQALIQSRPLYIVRQMEVMQRWHQQHDGHLVGVRRRYRRGRSRCVACGGKV